MKASTLLLAIAVAATLTAAAIVAADRVPAQVVRGSAGGWHATSAQQEFESPMCNIPRVSSSLSYDEFVREYQGRKPFVFTHTGPAVLKARTQLAKGLVLKRYSDVPVHLCNPEGAGPYRGCVLGKLGDWIEALQNNTVQPGARADEQHYLYVLRAVSRCTSTLATTSHKSHHCNCVLAVCGLHTGGQQVQLQRATREELS